MGAAASAISQQDLTNEEKTVITKVRERAGSSAISVNIALQFSMNEMCHYRHFMKCSILINRFYKRSTMRCVKMRRPKMHQKLKYLALFQRKVFTFSRQSKKSTLDINYL
jgi:hypothetical protein